MSNFYEGRDGKEHPIQYKAADLVNRDAPEGYVWTRRNEYDDYLNDLSKLHAGRSYVYTPWDKPFSQYDYYIAVKKETP